MDNVFNSTNATEYNQTLAVRSKEQYHIVLMVYVVLLFKFMKEGVSYFRQARKSSISFIVTPAPNLFKYTIYTFNNIRTFFKLYFGVKLLLEQFYKFIKILFQA